VVLAPQQERFILALVIDKGTNLLSMSRFLEEAKEEGLIYDLMPCQKGVIIDDEVSIELQEVLTEFADLVPKNL
jgi:hypothetical protein